MHFTECFVVAADRSFPEDPELLRHIESQMRDDANLAIVAFSADATHAFKIKTERMLILDRWIVDHFSNAEIRSPFRKSLDPFEIVHLILSFFEQWRLKQRSGNLGIQFRTSDEYNRSEMGWWLDLVAPPSPTAVDNDEIRIPIEDSVQLTFYSLYNKGSSR